MSDPIRVRGLRLRDVIPPFLGLLALAYIGYHVINGKRGLLAWFERSDQVEQAEAELATLTAQREALEHRVSLLRPESLDLDLLDERARAVLNLVNPDDIVIVEPEDEREPPSATQQAGRSRR